MKVYNKKLTEKLLKTVNENVNTVIESIENVFKGKFDLIRTIYVDSDIKADGDLFAIMSNGYNDIKVYIDTYLVEHPNGFVLEALDIYIVNPSPHIPNATTSIT